MTALSGLEIRKRLEVRDIAHRNKRLVVSPLLEPDEQLRDDQASLDVRLGFDFALTAPSTHAAVDEFKRNGAASSIPPAYSALFTRQYIPLGKHLVIHPHQFILATTLEYLRLPDDLMAYVIGRSTWGRLGLIVATAVGIQPRFAGALTLELRNLGETPIALYPGQVIAQLFFHRVEMPAMPAHAQNHATGVGQYSGTTDLIPRRLSSDKTNTKLRMLGAGI